MGAANLVLLGASLGATGIGAALFFAAQFGARPGEPTEPPRLVSEAPVTAMDQAQGLADNSPQLAVDPTAPRFVAAANRRDAPAFGCGLQVSGSDGEGWRSLDPVPKLPHGAKTCYAPEVAFGSEGRLFYLFTGLHGRGNEPMGVFLSSSDDRGRTFTDAQQVLGEHNFSARMAVDRTAGDGTRLYMAWLHASSDPPLGGMPPPPNPIQFARSSDAGDNWSEPVQINPPDRQRVAAPTMTVGPEGTVYVAYYDLKEDRRDYQGLAGPVYDGTWSLMLARSRNGGASFETTVVDDEVRPTERVMLIFTMAPPALAAGQEGQVCLGWPDSRRGNADVLARCSPDRGATWKGPTRINDSYADHPRDAGATQTMPQLDFAPNGRLDAVFLDRRHDPEDLAQHTYYKASYDLGQSFTHERRLSSHSSYSRIGQRYINKASEGKIEFGARLGVLAREENTLAVWPDTRNSRIGSTGQNLFSARLTHQERRNAEGVTGRLGGALAIGGLVLGAVGVVRQRYAVRNGGMGNGPRADARPPRGQTVDGDDGRRAPFEKRRRPSWRVLTWCGVAAGVVVGGSVLWDGESSARVPADPPELTVVVTDERIGYDGVMPPGRVVVRVANQGDSEHRVTLMPMDHREAPLEEQLSDDAVQISAPLAGTEPLAPGESTSFAVDLESDARYALADFSGDRNDPQDRSFAQKGVHREFRTGQE